MSRYLSYTLFFALLIACGYIYISSNKRAALERENSIARESILKEEIKKLEARSDSLLEQVVLLDLDLANAEARADSLGKVANSPGLPCEHELALRKEEVKAVRMALDKCKEAKGIQTTVYGLQEMVVEHKIDLCADQIKMYQKDFKVEKRKAFLRGAGLGAVVTAALIILAL